MKIGILGTRGIPNAYGGFEQFAQFLAKGLLQKGHKVSVYNSSLHTYQQSSWEGVDLIHCYDPENKLGTIGQFIYDLNCFKDARNKNFDILLQLGYTSSSVWYHYWPKKAINIINMDGLEWKRTKYNKITQGFLKWAEKAAVQNADVLIADSVGIREYLKTTYNIESFFIPYGADVPSSFSPEVLKDYDITKDRYYLLIARMEPENNIEMVIQGYKEASPADPLLLIGNPSNKFGQYLSNKYASDKIRFIGSIYDVRILNSLRHYSSIYFHGHTVGGTNPSLLEAMACGCNIAAHDNIFNRAILEENGTYFSTAAEISNIIRHPLVNDQYKENNIEKIKTTYNWKKIIDSYETIFLQATQTTKQ